jgi:hypothetical protein
MMLAEPSRAKIVVSDDEANRNGAGRVGCTSHRPSGVLLLRTWLDAICRTPGVKEARR